jgi:Ca2+/Na+ antiporter
MSRKNCHRRDKNACKRGRRWWHKLTWKDYVIYMPLALFLFLGSFGYYALDLYLHPSWWNGILLVVVTAFIGYVAWSGKRTRR